MLSSEVSGVGHNSNFGTPPSSKTSQRLGVCVVIDSKLCSAGDIPEGIV